MRHGRTHGLSRWRRSRMKRPQSRKSILLGGRLHGAEAFTSLLRSRRFEERILLNNQRLLKRKAQRLAKDSFHRLQTHWRDCSKLIGKRESLLHKLLGFDDSRDDAQPLSGL